MTPDTQKAFQHLRDLDFVEKEKLPFPGGVAQFLESLEKEFSRYFDPEEVRRRLAVPAPYLDFLTSVKGIWVKRNWASVYDMKTALDVTSYAADLWLNTSEELKEEGEEMNDCGAYSLWLTVGWWSDKHEMVLNCDREHPHYGKVWDGYDYHPWMYEGEFDEAPDYDSFLDYTGNAG